MIFITPKRDIVLLTPLRRFNAYDLLFKLHCQATSYMLKSACSVIRVSIGHWGDKMGIHIWV